MSKSILNVFSENDIQYLLQLPEVIAARNRLGASVRFTIPVTETIRTALEERLGLDLSSVTQIPMRWIKGDTAAHIDRGASAFEHTYLVYVNDSEGSFVLGTESYPIQANTLHKTEDTGLEPRLLVGPMNELAEPVGASFLFFYPSQANALANTNEIANYGGYTIPVPGLVGGFSHWRIASNSTGPANQNRVYTSGDVLDGSDPDTYYLYVTAPCFKEGTQILCQVNGVDTYKPIETLMPGTLIKTSRDGYKKVEVLGQGTLQNPGTSDRSENRLYKCSKTNYPEITEDLFITGCHSILVNKISDKQRDATIKQLGRIFVTDKKYRLMACLDDRAEPFASEGQYTIYHIALEHTDPYMNYGIYANGLLVETCCLDTLKNKSNMTLVSPAND